MAYKPQELYNRLINDPTLMNQLNRNRHCVFFHDCYRGEKFMASLRSNGVYILCFRGSGSLPLSNHLIAEYLEPSRFNGMFGPFY